MKRTILFGIWDTNRKAFWLRNDSDKRLRIGFRQSAEALKEISGQASLGFRGLTVKRFEANREEFI